MRKDLMPQARTIERPQGIEWDIAPQARERWQPNLMAAAASDDASTISIFDQIGVDFWTGEGVTAKRISAALRSIGPENDVVVNINSPGGDLFEGLAIYSLFREHKGNVTMKVLGLAASAASIIAMAGDDIQISRAGFLMVHDTWVVVMGNRNDLRDVADQLEPFDFAMADIYAARTGIDAKTVMKKMDAETWINGSAAVDEGWADSLLPSDAVRENKAATRSERPAAYQLDVALAKAGMPRSERRALLQDYKASKPSAADRTDTPRAVGDDTPRAVETDAALLSALQSFSIEPAQSTT
jgi:ATP-dependent Clp protease protease subunit